MLFSSNKGSDDRSQRPERLWNAINGLAASEAHLNLTGWKELSQTPILRPAGDLVWYLTDAENGRRVIRVGAIGSSTSDTRKGWGESGVDVTLIPANKCVLEPRLRNVTTALIAHPTSAQVRSVHSRRQEWQGVLRERVHVTSANAARFASTSL